MTPQGTSAKTLWQGKIVFDGYHKESTLRNIVLAFIKMKQKLRSVHPFDSDVLWWLSLKIHIWTHFLLTKQASQQWFLATGTRQVFIWKSHYPRTTVQSGEMPISKHFSFPRTGNSPIFHRKWPLRIVLLIIPLKAKSPCRYAWETFSWKSPKVLVSQWFAVK